MKKVKKLLKAAKNAPQIFAYLKENLECGNVPIQIQQHKYDRTQLFNLLISNYKTHFITCNLFFSSLLFGFITCNLFFSSLLFGTICLIYSVLYTIYKIFKIKNKKKKRNK